MLWSQEALENLLHMLGRYGNASWGVLYEYAAN